MAFHYIKGTNNEINIDSYKKFCSVNNLKCMNTVFIFPGNATHNTENNKLYSIKTEIGLAKVAEEIGREGYRTLILPTTGMDEWDYDDEQKKTVDKAIADLYRAVGAGYDLALPVRAHENDMYFNDGLVQSEDLLEPRFWGGERNNNKELAQYYIDCLDELTILADTLVIKRGPLLEKLNPLFHNAYKEGQHMSPFDPLISKKYNFNSQFIYKFIIALCITAAVVAYVALNAATFGVVDLVLLGSSALIGCVGLFAYSAYKKADDHTPVPSMYN